MKFSDIYLFLIIACEYFMIKKGYSMHTCRQQKTIKFLKFIQRIDSDCAIILCWQEKSWLIWYFLECSYTFNMIWKIMNDVFLSLKFPYNNTSMKCGCHKVSISLRQKYICYVITLISKFFILEQNFAIKVIQT